MMKIILVGLVCLFGLLHARPASEKEQLINELAERLVTRYMDGADEYINFLHSMKRQVEAEIAKRQNYQQVGSNTSNSGTAVNSGNYNSGNVANSSNNAGVGK